MAKTEGRIRPKKRRREVARPREDLREMTASKLSQLFNTLTKGKRAAAIGQAQRSGQPLTSAQTKQLDRARAANREIDRRYRMERERRTAGR